MIVVRYILPALRVAIAKELIEKYGLRRTEVAEKMDITPAAVTQYLKRSRGGMASTMVEGSSRVMDLVSDITRDLAQGESPADMLLLKVCLACRAVRAEELICDLHKEAMPSLREVETCACSPGFVGRDQVKTD